MTIEQVAYQIAKLCQPVMIHKIVIEEAEDAIKKLNVARVQECADLGFSPNRESWVLDSIFSNTTHPLEDRLALLSTVVKNWCGVLDTEHLLMGLVCKDVVELTAAAKAAGLMVPSEIEVLMVLRAINKHSNEPLRGAELVLKMMAAGFTITELVVCKTIRVYFANFHRRWSVRTGSRREYIEFINTLIENDSVVLGPESIPDLKRLGKLSLLSRKAKSKIQAAAIAAELVGIQQD
jgi:hypothetical protein